MFSIKNFLKKFNLVHDTQVENVIDKKEDDKNVNLCNIPVKPGCVHIIELFKVTVRPKYGMRFLSGADCASVKQKILLEKTKEITFIKGICKRCRESFVFPWVEGGYHVLDFEKMMRYSFYDLESDLLYVKSKDIVLKVKDLTDNKFFSISKIESYIPESGKKI